MKEEREEAIYQNFAGVYDELMDNVPYGDWCGRLTGLLADCGVRGGLMLDLGCGTGRMTELMADAGFDMIGVDVSVDMLEIASAKAAARPDRDSFLYLQQDMSDFELYGTVACAVCVCDSLNYLTEPEAVERTFRLVNNYLDPGGIFLFDFHTPAYYETALGDTTIAEEREDVAFLWFNEYEKETRLHEIDLTVFVREEGDRYRRFSEEHIQRAYTLSEIEAMLERAGLTFLRAFDGYGGGDARPESERILVMARENGKERQ